MSDETKRTPDPAAELAALRLIVLEARRYLRDVLFRGIGRARDPLLQRFARELDDILEEGLGTEGVRATGEIPYEGDLEDVTLTVRVRPEVAAALRAGLLSGVSVGAASLEYVDLRDDARRGLDDLNRLAAFLGFNFPTAARTTDYKPVDTALAVLRGFLRALEWVEEASSGRRGDDPATGPLSAYTAARGWLLLARDGKLLEKYSVRKEDEP